MRSVPRMPWPQRCHPPGCYWLDLSGVNGAWISQAGWSCSKPWRKKANRIWLASANLLRDLRLDGDRTTEAEVVLQRFEAIYEALLFKLNGLNGERAAAD